MFSNRHNYLIWVLFLGGGTIGSTLRLLLAGYRDHMGCQASTRQVTYWQYYHLSGPRYNHLTNIFLHMLQ